MLLFQLCVCVALIILGAANIKPLGWVAMLFAVIALLIAVGAWHAHG